MTTTTSSSHPTAPQITLTRTGKRLPLTPQQQMEAIQRVQAQAEQRVELGLKLFKAAQSQTEAHKQVISQIKTEQQQLRDEVHRDVAQSLHSYDQWVGQIDETFTRSIQALEEKIEKLQATWTHTQQRIETMIQRSNQMLKEAPPATPQTQANPQTTPKAPEAISPEDSLKTPSIAPPEIADEVAEASPSDPPQNDMPQAMYTQLLKQLRDSKKTKTPEN